MIVRWRRTVLLLLATLALSLSFTGAAAAFQVEWCVKDPVFVIDGRVVKVVALVPAAQLDERLTLTLTVHRAADVSWYIPEGEEFVGKIRIQRSDSLGRDDAHLSLTGGSAFPLRVEISGDGLRGDGTLAEMTSSAAQGLSIALKLDRIPGE